VTVTVAVLARPPRRRPARVRTGGTAIADSHDNSSKGKAHSPLGYPKRITLDLTVDDHHALQGARYADRVPMADRLRALSSLWREDPALAQAVSTRAQELLLAAAPSPAASPEPPAETDDPKVPPVS